MEKGGGTGAVNGPASATDNAIARFDGATGKLIQNSAITVDDNGVVSYPDNVRQTFNPGADAAGLNVGSVAGDPGTPSSGDLWYDSTADELTARIDGEFRGENRLDDLFDDSFANLLVWNAGSVLGAEQHGIDSLGSSIGVLDRHLGLAVRAKPGQTACLADLRQAAGQLKPEDVTALNQLLADEEVKKRLR